MIPCFNYHEEIDISCHEFHMGRKILGLCSPSNWLNINRKECIYLCRIQRMRKVYKVCKQGFGCALLAWKSKHDSENKICAIGNSVCIVKYSECGYCVCFYLVPHVHEKVANSKYRKLFLWYICVQFKTILHMIVWW